MAIFSRRLAVALGLAMALPLTAKAQLIDPNKRCVIRPGSTICEPIGTPPAPQLNEPVYEAFSRIASNTGISLADHPTYKRDYVEERARLYCGLLGQGEMMKVVREVSFPPVVRVTETPKDRSRLEVAILRTGTAGMCLSQWAQEQQLEATIVR